VCLVLSCFVLWCLSCLVWSGLSCLVSSRLVLSCLVLFNFSVRLRAVGLVVWPLRLSPCVCSAVGLVAWTDTKRVRLGPIESFLGKGFALSHLLVSIVLWY
jgi:hypothetical protein